MAKTSRFDLRRAVHARIRKRMRGTAARPRLAVFRSIMNISVQIIDDDRGATLASAASLDASIVGKYGGNIAAAREVGKLIAARALDAGIQKVVFDRGGFAYHGRVKALADAAREAGLEF
ncbi:MAG: 50S ribosomal protein L18 [Acidobacteria bacterium]|nr:50S ribosomal protein L18 [Acidobacteriota bacterium]